jgi:N-acetylglucosamine malate deacetylase 2
METKMCIRVRMIERLTNGRTLVLVAHPDDEAIGCGVLLQRIRTPIVAFATDGAPKDRYFWGKYGSQERYAELRRQEAALALSEVGVDDYEFLQLADDQELYRELPQARSALSAFVSQVKPSAIVTHTYEGGHPDHDTCAFLAAELARDRALPVFEMPLYHRAEGVGHKQQFMGDPGEMLANISEPERMRKAAMWRSYASQGSFMDFFEIDREVFRPQPQYDFSQPPHPGTLNYEAWQWKMSGADLCRTFTSFRRKVAA